MWEEKKFKNLKKLSQMENQIRLYSKDAGYAFTNDGYRYSRGKVKSLKRYIANIKMSCTMRHMEFSANSTRRFIFHNLPHFFFFQNVLLPL